MTRAIAPLRVFVQARMTSRRLPGKVLAPVAGQPMIRRVLERLIEIVAREHLVVLTSTDATDDPLEAYVRTLDVAVFRGSLDNVFDRFRSALDVYRCEWFVRVCADSPLVDATLLDRMLPIIRRPDVDLVTNVFPRTFPKGQSLELVRHATFAQIDTAELSRAQQEHVTLVYYEHADRFTIANVTSDDPLLAHTSLAVDTIEDLHRIEALVDPLTPATGAEAARP